MANFRVHEIYFLTLKCITINWSKWGAKVWNTYSTLFIYRVVQGTLSRVMGRKTKYMFKIILTLYLLYNKIFLLYHKINLNSNNTQYSSYARKFYLQWFSNRNYLKYNNNFYDMAIITNTVNWRIDLRYILTQIL